MSLRVQFMAIEKLGDEAVLGAVVSNSGGVRCVICERVVQRHDAVVFDVENVMHCICLMGPDGHDLGSVSFRDLVSALGGDDVSSG